MLSPKTLTCLRGLECHGQQVFSPCMAFVVYLPVALRIQSKVRGLEIHDQFVFSPLAGGGLWICITSKCWHDDPVTRTDSKPWLQETCPPGQVLALPTLPDQPNGAWLATLQSVVRGENSTERWSTFHRLILVLEHHICSAWNTAALSSEV